MSMQNVAGTTGEILEIPRERREALESALPLLEGAEDIALTTHVNADGDGAGSETALAAWLLARGKRVAITNPTPYPPRFAYLLPPEVEVLDPGPEQDARLRTTDLLVVLDTSERGRIGRVAGSLREGAVVVLDHHPPSAESLDVPGVQDPTACATGEIIYDLITLGDAGAWPKEVIEGVYAAIETDTGSFRFSNTTPRTHAVAADLLRRGVDPEEVYRKLHATVPLKRLDIIRISLEYLETDPELPITWISIPRLVTHEMKASADDLDGVAEYARSVEGTEVALLFRETLDGSTKVSFRSNGAVDVNVIARRFGGGGHVKASGALIGEPMSDARPGVLDATRQAVRETLLTGTEE
ncbi:MAG TPA: bifunctional oligoribonuclease/PAP phosphatase NrnA [Longimicrobiales bacterium]|nr:bifunctional oligoribonuclease/PAP phosphatase NrnA [Longimicrobiales bacterium]